MVGTMAASITTHHREAAVAFDEVPYDSKPFSQTNPLLLQGIGRLFGLTAPSPYTARILEIGCATGSNILAIASLYPESRCIGIDYSERQIKIGRNKLEAQGITNLDLRHMSIMDITPDFGTFDYIICHGIISWVPKEVQKKVFEVCKTNLSQSGIAYISHNTLPGWSVVGVVRDMMLYHTSSIKDLGTKAQQARHILKFAGDAMRQSENSMAPVINKEIEYVSKHPDYYLLQDHLAECNDAWYFHEFVEYAKSYGLQYLADICLEIMFSDNLPPAISQSLPGGNDFIRRQQYIDFICNRRFRTSLLCHDKHALNFKISAEMLREGWLVSKFTYPEGFRDHDIKSGQVLEFRSLVSDLAMTTGDPIFLAMLQIFMEQNNAPIGIADLTGQVRNKLNKLRLAFNEESLEKTLSLYVMRYIFTRGILFYLEKPPFISTVSEKPEVSSLARYQSLRQNWVTNQMMENLEQLPFTKILMRYVDGARTRESLNHAMLSHFVSGELVFNENAGTANNQTALADKVRTRVEECLKDFGSLGLLVQ